MKKLKLEELNRPDIFSFKKQDKRPLAIVLDNVRSLNNVGSIFRTADAFSVSQVYLCGITGQPPHREIHKSALGASESVDWLYFEKTIMAIEKLKNEAYKIYALEQTDSSIDLYDFNPDFKEKIAFVFGNEVDGVSEELLPFVDKAIEIPQFGTKHSFNVAVSAGIVLWDYYLKNKRAGL